MIKQEYRDGLLHVRGNDEGIDAVDFRFTHMNGADSLALSSFGFNRVELTALVAAINHVLGSDPEQLPMSVSFRIEAKAVVGDLEEEVDDEP